MSALAFDLRGAAYLDKGDLNHAKADYTEASRLDPTDEMAVRELARLR
jgi:predicted negative regulator of RcsB-dependent stress response